MSIAGQKASVPDDFIYLFQERDRRVTRRSDASSEEEEDDEFEVGYFATRAVVLQRLDFAGYTAERARQSFESWLNEERENYLEIVEYVDRLAVELRDFGYDEWKKRVKGVLLTRYDFSRPRDIYVDIVWGGYVNKVQLYQGALALTRFLEETDARDESVNYAEHYPELIVLWEHIFSLLKPG